MKWIRWILAYVFDCVHRRITWPHRDDRGFDYVCCLDCGKELPYSTRRMSIVTREILLADRNSGEKFGNSRFGVVVTFSSSASAPGEIPSSSSW